MKELEEKIQPDQKAKLEAAVGRVKEALKGTNNDEIKSAADDLNKIWSEIAPSLYQQGQPGPEGGPQGGPQAGPDPSAAQEQPSGDDAAENVDYEVVDEDEKK